MKHRMAFLPAVLPLSFEGMNYRLIEVRDKRLKPKS